VDFSKSKVISATDDTGRDLLGFGAENEKEKADRARFWSAKPDISEDGLACLIQTSIFNPLAPPAPEAKSVRLKAEVYIKTDRGGTLVPVELTFSLGMGN